MGIALLGALKTEAKRTTSKGVEEIPVVLIGHDRGARVAHRLAVSGVDGVDIRGVCLIDIVSYFSIHTVVSYAHELHDCIMGSNGELGPHNRAMGRLFKIR